ncbi:Ubiquinone/menaquinone biosynthesis C-methyltransferase UbiE [Candidatus Tiddalikarchaeum anstoanum]|nr:Ubiquinone/menaquinone biosynthesis C-methyltransferase UbiE [Candidatus Tiddalikarchaeum anstoanum]
MYYEHVLPKPYANKYSKFMREIQVLHYYDILGEPKRVLDIGCGWGAFLEFLPKKVEAFGLDNNETFIKYAAKKGLNVKLGDAKKLQFKDGVFDAVCSDCVIEHLDNRYEIIKEWSRVLKKGGKMMLVFPDIRRRKWEFFNDYTHRQPVHPRAIIEILKDNGFDINIVSREWVTPRGLGRILYYLNNKRLINWVNGLTGKIFSYKSLIVATKV